MMRFLKQSVVGEKTGTWPRNGDWWTNFKNLEEAMKRTAEEGHNVKFYYRTATRYLTRHFPLCQWTTSWSICPPPTHGQRRSGLSGNTQNYTETITDKQTGLYRQTNWWMEDIQMAGDPRGFVHYWTLRRWIQHLHKSWPLLAKSVIYAKLNRFILLLRTAKCCVGLLDLAMAMQKLRRVCQITKSTH